MRGLRQVIDRIVTHGGALVVLSAIVVVEASLHQVVLVLLGLLLVQLGTWRIASRVLPSRRTNPRLRSEVDQFLESVRELFRLANQNLITDFDTLANGMQDRAERVVEAARIDLKSGLTDDRPRT